MQSVAVLGAVLGVWGDNLLIKLCFGESETGNG